MGRPKRTGDWGRSKRWARSATPSNHLAVLLGSLDDLRADLADLEASPSYLVLTDLRPGTATAERYHRVAADSEGLWSLLQAASDRLSGVHGLGIDTEPGVAPGAWSLSADEEAVLEGYLREPWLGMDEFSSPVAASPATITELVEELRRRVDSLQEAAGEIERAWTEVLPRIDAARRTLARLQTEADSLAVKEPLIGRATALADDLAERLVADPASVHPDDGLNLDQQVAAAARQMATLRAGHDSLADDLAGTEEILAALRVLRARAEAGAKESRLKIAQPDGLVRVPSEQMLDGERGLAAQLDQIFDLAGAWTQRRGLLDTWLTTAERLGRQLRAADEANRAPIDRRNELRGRLQAYVAKMAGTGRAEDLQLSDLVQEARTLLYHSPTDLNRAEATIADLAARLQA